MQNLNEAVFVAAFLMLQMSERSSSLPLPPLQYVKHYTDENIARGRALSPPKPITVSTRVDIIKLRSNLHGTIYLPSKQTLICQAMISHDREPVNYVRLRISVIL